MTDLYVEYLTGNCIKKFYSNFKNQIRKNFFKSFLSKFYFISLGGKKVKVKNKTDTKKQCLIKEFFFF